MSPSSLTFKRGETIYKEGSPADQIYLLQSGIVTLVVRRGEKNIEISQASANQIFGEESWWGRKTRLTGAVANNDVTLVPLAAGQALIAMEAGSPLLSSLAKGLIERQRTVQHRIWRAKVEASDPTPCAPEKVAKLFAVIYHCAKYTGTVQGAQTSVIWPAFKKYTQRMFLESPVRLESAVNILVNLGHAKLQFIPCETDPEAPDELGYVHFTNLEAIRSFFEYFREHGKDPGKAEPDGVQAGFLREIAAWNQTGKVMGASTDVDAA